ncbi:MAG: NUDIX domain-containing protein [Chloroflexota bacterium]
MVMERERANPPRDAYRDPGGRTLADYPRPSVAVDTAVLTVPEGGALGIVLVRPGPGDDASARGRHRLPGTFLHEGERLAEAVLRSLRDKAGVTGLDPRQLHVFDDPDRDDRGRVLSVAHVVTVAARDLVIDETKVALVSVDRIPDLAYRHDAIVRLAVASLRAEYASVPDPRHLLEPPFTLHDLQALHEAIAGTRIPRDAFRRAMQGGLTETGRSRRGVVGKPARLFTIRSSS